MLAVAPERDPHRPIAAPDFTRPSDICALTYIARRAGMEDRSARWLLGYVRQLIRDHDFPEPFNPRLYRGRLLIGAEAVNLRSRWYRCMVDDWFNGFLPSPVALLIDNIGIDEYADTLDARAALIGGGR